MISAGELDKQIRIEQLTTERDAAGGVKEVWTTFASPWVKVVSSKGAESFEAARTNAKRTVKFKMRWRSGVLPTMRVVWNDQHYDIFEVDDSKRREGELWITATAQVNG